MLSRSALVAASAVIGTMIAEGTSGELKASVGAGVLRVRLVDPKQRPRAEQMLSRALEVPVRAGI
jgi:ABC-2 type transport system ATP-binding protein